MVSAYFFPVNLTNPDPKRPDLPRLSSVSEGELDVMRNKLSKVVKARRDLSARIIDWQGHCRLDRRSLCRPRGVYGR